MLFWVSFLLLFKLFKLGHLDLNRLQGLAPYIVHVLYIEYIHFLHFWKEGCIGFYNVHPRHPRNFPRAKPERNLKVWQCFTAIKFKIGKIKGDCRYSDKPVELLHCLTPTKQPWETNSWHSIVKMGLVQMGAGQNWLCCTSQCAAQARRIKQTNVHWCSYYFQRSYQQSRHHCHGCPKGLYWPFEVTKRMRGLRPLDS